MNRFVRSGVWAVEIVAALYGIYNAATPSSFPFRHLDPGMGLGLAIISLTMLMVLWAVEAEREARTQEDRGTRAWSNVAGRLHTYLPAHERDFYALWPSQMAGAHDNVDITHLGPKPPQSSSGEEERRYFEDLRATVRSTRAIVRRVERVTPEKLPWIERLVAELRGQVNFSLKAYPDPSDGEMPFAMSVCRVDERFAWVVALAEQESTSGHRDLLITGRDGVDLVRRYFQERLWERSIPVMEHGEEATNWRQSLDERE